MTTRADQRTYRQIADQDYALIMCGSPNGCRRGLSESAHVHGKIDRANVIHLLRADNQLKRTGLRSFLKLVARATHPEWRGKLLWERLYLENTWASKTARSRYKTMIPVAESRADRDMANRAARRAGVRLRTANFMAYQWVRQVYTSPTTKT